MKAWFSYKTSFRIVQIFDYKLIIGQKLRLKAVNKEPLLSSTDFLNIFWGNFVKK